MDFSQKMFRTVVLEGSGLYRERSSRFLGFCFPASAISDVEFRLGKFKKEHSQATHLCYAYRIEVNASLSEFATDAGEPKGTAGMPILNTMKRFELANAAVCVVRYYGGTKLGKPGLIEAYTAAASLAVEQAVCQETEYGVCFKVKYPYSAQSVISRLESGFHFYVGEQHFGEEIMREYWVSLAEREAFETLLSSFKHLIVRYEVSAPKLIPVIQGKQ